MSKLTPAALQSLIDLLGPRQVVTNPIELITYEIDAGQDRGCPDAAVFPTSTEDVANLAAWAAEHGVPLVGRGAGTGLSGGAVAESGGVIVSFSRMGCVIDLDEAGRSAVVQPGVVNMALDDLVKTKGLYFPPDPASGRTSTIGGNIGENAGGPHCFKYGVTSNYITGMQVVLPGGRVARLCGRAYDYPEYDFPGLITGSEGTLALVTETSVRLVRNAPGIKTLMAVFDTVEEAGTAVSAVIARGLVPATMEMMDQKIIRIVEEFAHAGLPTDAGSALIIEADGYAESVTPQIEEIAAILTENGGRDLRVAQTAAERERIWYARKSAAGAMARLAPAYYLVDGTVPRSKLSETLAAINQVIEAAELTVGYVFHAGDGNLHPLILIPDPSDPALLQRIHQAGHRLMELAVAHDGSITGEHGVGIEKRHFMPLMYTPAELSAMWDVKDVFDPTALFNPGKVLPQPRPVVELCPGPHTVPEGPVYRPLSTRDAADALRAWTLAAPPPDVRIRGAGTKSLTLSGNDSPAGITLSTSALQGICVYAPEDLYVTVGAGTTLAELQAELARDRVWTPLASPWPESTLGGIIASNANAPLRMRYGGARDLLMAATVALPDGRVIRAGRPVVKNVAGYDLAKVFVGSHGTLGLITDVTLKVAPLPRARASLIVPVDDLARGLEWGAALLQVALVASAVLLCRGCTRLGLSSPYALVYTAEGVPEDVDAELSQARRVLQAGGARGLTQVDAPSGSELWASWLSEVARSGTMLRAGVAPRDVSRLLARIVPALDTAAPVLADLASGMCYVKTAAPSEIGAIRQAAQAADGYAVVVAAPPGAVTAADAWGHTPDALPEMRELKAKWDPKGILNKGNFYL